MISSKRAQKPRVTQYPSLEKKLESGLIKRCGVCWREWEASAFTVEEGAVGTPERCPVCVDERTSLQKLADQVQAQERAKASEPEPQQSNAPLRLTFPGTVREMTDSNGTQVKQSAPLALTRTVAKTLLLLGRDFSASDTISGSDGLTINVDSRTATQTDLSITAASSMTPGNNYHLIFNSVYFHNVFSVR